MTQPIDQTLAERGSRYGEFDAHAEVTQNIKGAMSTGLNWPVLPDDMKEALEMIAHKMGRILNGDPDYIDSWTDIIGYARLVEKRLIDEQAPVAEAEPEASVNNVKGIDAFFAALKGVAEGMREAQDKCDDPECPGCHPETASVKRADIDAALAVLVKAGVIRQVTDEDGSDTGKHVH